MADEQRNNQTETRQSFFEKQQLIESVRTAFQLLAAALRNATFYPQRHPILLDSAEKLKYQMEKVLEGRSEAAFYLVRGELFFETTAVPIDRSFSEVIEQFTGKDIGGIVFKPNLTSDEIIRFANMMSSEIIFSPKQESLNVATTTRGILHIVIHHILLVDKQVGSIIKAREKKASDIFKDTISALKEVVEAAYLEKASSTRKMNLVMQNMVDYVLDNRDALVGLTSIKMYDEHTFAHSVNTAILAVSLGTYLSLDKPQLAALGVAALLHDIGKVGIPKEIINKPGKLTEEEWVHVRQHPIAGALFLSNIPSISKIAMVIAFEHHQHGKNGYPAIESDHKRHSFSQIVSLADSYEAITASRIYYASKIPPEEAIRILMENRGVTSSSALLQAFINMIGIFPIGTLVKLDTGEVGLVMHQTGDLMRPRVLLLNKFDGSEKETGDVVSLVETIGGNYKRSISGTIDPNIAKIDIKKYFD